MKKACFVLFGLMLVSGPGCNSPTGSDQFQNPMAQNPMTQKSTTPTSPPGKPGSSPGAPSIAIDRVLDDWLTYISGLAATSDVYKKKEEAPFWLAFAKSVNVQWTSFDSSVLVPMKQWAGQDLRESRLITKTLFCPFGGPDLVTSVAFYPEAMKTVLMGLEPVGNLPDFDGNTPEWAGQFFKDSELILSDFLKSGYFVIEHMNEAFTKGRVDGALPLMGFFLKRTGNSIVGVRRLAVNGKGGWVETPYASLKKFPKRPCGVRVDYVRTGDKAIRSVYYFSCDPGDATFKKNSPVCRLFDGFEAVTTLIRSASYRLHYDDFPNLRNMIMTKSLYVLEDDTCIPYGYFKRAGWEIQLYGAYAKPAEGLSAVVEQKDLKAAYDDPAGNVRKLPFHFGYGGESKIDSLLLMKRPQAKLGTLKAASIKEQNLIRISIDNK